MTPLVLLLRYVLILPGIRLTSVSYTHLDVYKRQVDELENFLEHVENCPSCYDELETYFIVHAAMQQLDERCV